MSDNLNPEVWLVGAGPMAMDYVKVIRALGIPFKVIGRGKASAENFYSKTGIEVLTGGLEEAIKQFPLPSAAIVATGIETLAQNTLLLMQAGVKKILLEKPGIAAPSEINHLVEQSKQTGTTVLLAYNRRFYASVLKAKEIIEQDGGVVSFNFEFTEWAHEIKHLKKPEIVMHHWFLGNSSHVVDLAFYLGGKPETFRSFTKGGVAWHPSSSVFAGAGISSSGALFSYQANWEAPGRWGVEILTAKHRLIFRPMEKLHIQRIGSVAIEPCEGIDYTLDEQFKPGLYRQVESFIRNDLSAFSTIVRQQENLHDFYLEMAGYPVHQLS